MDSEFNWEPVESIEARVAARMANQQRIEREVEAHNQQVAQEYAQAKIEGISAVGDFAKASATLAETFKSRVATPRGHIGAATPQAKWAGDLCYFTENWLSPSLNEVRAYDMMVSIYGYNQAGRRVVLMKNINGERANNFMSRKNFTYLRLSAAHINGNLGIYKGAIEAAFNKGIRFWDPTFAGSLGSFPTDVIKTNTKR